MKGAVATAVAIFALSAGCRSSSSYVEAMCTFPGLENVPASSPQCVPPAPPPPLPSMCPYPGFEGITATDPACAVPPIVVPRCPYAGLGELAADDPSCGMTVIGGGPGATPGTPAPRPPPRPSTGVEPASGPAQPVRNTPNRLNDILRELIPGWIGFSVEPDTLIVGKSGRVRVVIDPRSAVPPTEMEGLRGFNPDTARFSPRTQVCLLAPEFLIQNAPGNQASCQEQQVALNIRTQWLWAIIPLAEKIGKSDSVEITVIVNALSDDAPPQLRYTRPHRAYVYVEAPKPPGLMEQVTDFLKQWQVLLGAIAGIVAILGPFAMWLQSRKSRSKA